MTVGTLDAVFEECTIVSNRDAVFAEGECSEWLDHGCAVV
jgi:hypothetical protein